MIINFTKRKVAFVVFVLLSFKAFSQTAPTSGGPDDYGYTWNRFRAVDGAKWIEIANRTGTIDITQKATQTNIVGPVNFSFDFPYYWYTRNSFYIGRIGYLAFNPITLGAPFDELPLEDGQGNDFIAALVSNITIAKDGAKIYFWSDFKDSVIVSYENLGYRQSQGPPQGNVTFQIILSRRDSAITFNYADKIGNWKQTPCPTLTPGSVPTCEIIGIENVTGKVGLAAFLNNNDETMWAGISKADPLTIKFRPTAVASKKYSTKDMAVLWNNNPQNGGFFVSNSKKPLTLYTRFINQGTDSTTSIKKVSGTAKLGATTVVADSKNLPILAKSEYYDVAFTKKLATDNVGKYAFESSVPTTGDDASGNNTLKQLISVVDTTGESTILDYTDGIWSGVGISWTYDPTVPFGSGNGVYIEPPFYPVKIKQITFAVQGAGNTIPLDSIRFQIYDDDGKNIFGKIDGSRGRKIFQKTIGPLDYNFQEYESTSVDDTVPQINSGGVYVSILQGGRNTRLNTLPSSNVSYRTFEVSGAGAYNIYRNRTSEDFVLGIEISKGNLSQVSNLKLLSVINPKDSTDITDSSLVSIEILNNGKLPVDAPFNVTYQADQNELVLENVSLSTPIDTGKTFIYTFKKKVPRPIAPRTRYNSFCAKIYPQNDFNVNDNVICFGVNPGINNYSEINNFSLYPNPTNSGHVNVLYGIIKPSGIIIELVDLNGRVIQRKNVGMTSMGMHYETLNTQDLSEGVYNCRLISDHGIAFQKLVIVK